MRIVLLGAPGSGKGTQGKLLASKHKIPQISTGDLLRAAVSDGTGLGRQAKAAMDAGQLVSDANVLGIIGARIVEPDARKGFILDVFSRNIPQAEALDRMLEEKGTPLQAALLLAVDVAVLLDRLTGRRTCASCGTTYTVYTSPSRLDDRCDKCGGNLRHRADDNEETISNRLRVYDQQTSPLIAYYRTQDKLRTVNGEGGINDIAAEIEKALRQLPAAPAAAAPADEEASPSLDALRKKVMEAASSAKKKPAAESTKPAAAKAPVKAAVPEPVATKKAPAKKAVAKKAVVPQAAAVKKAPAKKPAAVKKPAVKKPVAKKAVAKKAEKKPIAKKVTVKKGMAKKAAAKKRGNNKSVVVKKSAVRKSAAKKAPAKKPIAKKKSASKKAAAKKGGVKKTASKKAMTRKTSAKKTVAKKAIAKKAVGKKGPAARKKTTRRSAIRRR